MEFKPFEKKVWLATPTMHGEELEYVKKAYETNWMSTVGENINEVERIAAEKAEMKYAVALSCCTAALHLCVKSAGEKLYGKPAISHGALEGKSFLLRYDFRRDAQSRCLRGRYSRIYRHRSRFVEYGSRSARKGV